MLALIYFGLAACVGDFICRRFYTFVSVAHRCAAAVLVGLLVSSWFTYLAGLAFWWASQPLLWGNLLFFVTALALLTWPKWKRKFKSTDRNTELHRRSDLYLPRPPGSGVADWLLIIGYVVLVSWMMFASFNSSDGHLRIANAQYSDFGPNTAIMQSFAVGHNFPTEYPHFSGDRIRYHFLFYFQAGNLEFLGLNPASSLNLLTIATLVAMLIVLMTLGELVFNSRAVGRLGSFLFFFFGSLSYVPFLQKQGSVRAAIQAITHRSDYLPSIFPYRGETWGTWSQVTYLNQRHFASSIGILMLVLVFLVIRYRAVPKRRAKVPPPHSTDVIGLQANPVPETAPNIVSDNAAPPEGLPDLQNQTAPVSENEDASHSFESFREGAEAATETATESKVASHSSGSFREGAEAATEPATESKVTSQSSETFREEAEPATESTVTSQSSETFREEAEAATEPATESTVASHSSESFREEAEVATELATEAKQETVLTPQPFRASLPGFIFSGVLLGLLPMWNSAVFIAAAAMLAALFVLFPLRPQMFLLAITSGLIAMPQTLYLTGGSDRAQMPRLLHWGYMVEQPTALNVAKYLGFTFGFKWLLIALALILAGSLQRRFFIAALSLLAVAFSFQFTIEVLANQKFLHIWVIIANLFVAFALWRLWRFSLVGTTIPGKFVAIVLFLLVVPGGIIDLFPIHNTGWSEVQYRNDPLIDWLKKNTSPRDIFLTDRFVTHPILMAGRRILYGWPYYAWSAGYNAGKYDKLYTELFEGKDPWKVYHLLKENGIKYVAYDNAVLQGQFIKHPNQQLYATYFPKVFENSSYNGLVVYKVPETPPPQLQAMPEGVSNMFEGGKGTGKGEFDFPTGIAVDANGNVFVGDTNNGRIEKFSPTGAFLSIIGTKGPGQGQLAAPNGIGIDRSGNIYVADAGNHRVEKLSPDGRLIAEWKGPDVGFYGPRRIAIGPDDSIYVVDQGRTRIVKFHPDGHVLQVWGTKGNGDGQFDDPTSVAVDPATYKVYVADPRNKRIQVFDSNGKFLTKWAIAEWGQPAGFEDLIIDSAKSRLYASSVHMNTVLILDLNGNRIGTLMPKPPDRFEGPSALALFNRKLYVLNMYGNSVNAIDL